MIDLDRLIAAGIQPTQARQILGPLTAACALHGIDNGRRIAGFIAQCGHESLGFTRLEENLNWRDSVRAAQVFGAFKTPADAAPFMGRPVELANVVYANLNGNVASGDGWRYRGRGWIQLTGRANYRAMTTLAARDYEAHPDLVAQPDDAAVTSAMFWATAGLNALADAGMASLEAVTRKINRGMEGLDDRSKRLARALEAFK